VKALLLFLLLALPAPGAAGGEASELPGIGDRVRVLDNTGLSFTARVVDMLPGALVLRTKASAAPRVVSFTDLRSLERSLGWKTKAGKGALIGFAAGFALGTKIGSDLSCLDESQPCPRAGPALRGGAMTGTVTAGLGALIGLAFAHERWQYVPLPSGRSVRVQPALRPIRGGVAAGITIGF
jgi:hypothetical protein